jgi:hypothetical protein
MMLVGLLFLEVSLIIRFWILPEFLARNAPLGHWEMETPLSDSPKLWFALFAFLGVFALGNVGLIIMVRRAFKDLKVND